MKKSKNKFKALFSSVLVAFTLSATVHAAPVLWIDDANGKLGTVDLGTGAVTVIGDTHQSLVDIAFDPNGNLYGMTFTQLFKIDKATGTTTLVGNFGSGSALNSLVFNSTGALFAADTKLYSINVNTGAATAVGNGNVNGSDPFSSSGDLAFSAGSLYLTSNISSPDELVKLNLSNGKGQDIGSIGFSNVYGLASINDTLYGVTGTQILTINATTGFGTSFLNYGGKGLGTANGAAFYSEAGAVPVAAVPEPATVALLGLGLLGFAASRHKSAKSKTA